MNPYATWIDVKTLAEIKKITPRAVRLALPRSGYTFREVNSSGGKSYEILLSSLEPKLQDIYRDRYYQKVIELEAEIDSVPASKQIQTQQGFIPETAKTIALARIDLIQEWQRFRNKHQPKQKGDKIFLDLYNSGEYLKNVFVIIGKTSRGSLMRWHKSYTEYENWKILVPQYNYTSFNEYRTILTEEEIGIFLKLLLHPNQFSILKKYLPKEDIKFLETQMIEETIPQQIEPQTTKPEPITIPNKLRPVFMNNYERYEWLMENGCTSVEERKWLDDYKNSDEYKLIFGDDK